MNEDYLPYEEVKSEYKLMISEWMGV